MDGGQACIGMVHMLTLLVGAREMVASWMDDLLIKSTS
jgi:hypothetical protein